MHEQLGLRFLNGVFNVKRYDLLQVSVDAVTKAELPRNLLRTVVLVDGEVLLLSVSDFDGDYEQLAAALGCVHRSVVAYGKDFFI